MQPGHFLQAFCSLMVLRSRKIQLICLLVLSTFSLWPESMLGNLGPGNPLDNFSLSLWPPKVILSFGEKNPRKLNSLLVKPYSHRA